MFELTGPASGPLQGEKPTQLIIFLHGYGASGDDLIALAPVWAPILPQARFIAPHAPFPCDGNPFGFQWFPITQLDPHAMAAGVRGAAPILDAFLDDQLKKNGIDDSQMALVGFSQGTMMALHVGLRRARKLGAILGYSGVLTGRDTLKDEIKSRPPLLLIHGDADEMVPPQATLAAERTLKELEVPVQSHICRGLGHGIDETGVRLGVAFLKQTLG